MKLNRLLGGLALTVLLELIPGAAQAGIVTTYTDLPTFDAAVGATTTETFGNTNCFPLPGPINSSSSFTCGLTGSVTPGELQPGVTYSATTMGTGDTYFNLDSGGNFPPGTFLDAFNQGLGPNSLIATFDGPVSALGFNTTDLSGSSITVTLNFLGGGTDTEVESIGGGEPFFGFQSSLQDITSVSVLGDGSDNASAFDNFTFSAVGGSAPEPASIFLFGSGLVGVVIAARKRRKTV